MQSCLIMSMFSFLLVAGLAVYHPHGSSMLLLHYVYITIKFLCMFIEDRHGALYRSLLDCLVDAVLHVTGAHAVLPPHLLRHLGNPMAKPRGGSEVKSEVRPRGIFST